MSHNTPKTYGYFSFIAYRQFYGSADQDWKPDYGAVFLTPEGEEVLCTAAGNEPLPSPNTYGWPDAVCVGEVQAGVHRRGRPDDFIKLRHEPVDPSPPPAVE